MLTYKYRLYPTKNQTNRLNNTLDTCKVLYNSYLLDRKNTYIRTKKGLTYNEQSSILSEDKQRIDFLNNIHSQVLQDVLKRVDKAFKNFFRRVKENRDKVGYPRFKNHSYNSITYPQSGFEIINNNLKLSKIGHIKIKYHRQLEGKMKTCTIRKSATGKWYASFSCKTLPNPLPISDKTIGIDVGLTSFATFSDGSKINNPRFFRKEEKALAKAQRKLSKQVKGTPERYRFKKVVSKIYERITNKRVNFAHQESKKIVDNFGTISIEDLNIKSMLSNHTKVFGNKLNKSIMDAAWNQFILYLTYKAENAGRNLIKINPAYTSQICSQCGLIVKKTLNVRVHNCPKCNISINRDHNASLNILALGIQSIGTQSIEAPSYL